MTRCYLNDCNLHPLNCDTALTEDVITDYKMFACKCKSYLKESKNAGKGSYLFSHIKTGESD